MNIRAIPTEIPDTKLIEPAAFTDSRGTFFESFSKRDFTMAIGETVEFVQDNHSVSAKGGVASIFRFTGRRASSCVLLGEVLLEFLIFRKKTKEISLFYLLYQVVSVLRTSVVHIYNAGPPDACDMPMASLVQEIV